MALKDETIEIANYLLDKGADVNFMESDTSADSKGNTTLERVTLQASQIMSLYNPNTGQYIDKLQMT